MTAAEKWKLELKNKYQFRTEISDCLDFLECCRTLCSIWFRPAKRRYVLSKSKITTALDILDDTYTGLPSSIQLQHILVLIIVSRQRASPLFTKCFSYIYHNRTYYNFRYFLKKFWQLHYYQPARNCWISAHHIITWFATVQSTTTCFEFCVSFCDHGFKLNCIISSLILSKTYYIVTENKFQVKLCRYCSNRSHANRKELAHLSTGVTFNYPSIKTNFIVPYGDVEYYLHDIIAQVFKHWWLIYNILTT